MKINLVQLLEMVKDREACGAAVHGVTKSENDLEMEQQQQFKMNHSELFREHWVKEFVSFAKDSQPFNILVNISYGM